MWAPIRSSGSITRRMGRRLSDRSPPSVEWKWCAARTPVSSRNVEPEFPASRGTSGSRRPRRPRPVISTVGGLALVDRRVISTWSAWRQDSVAAQSAPGANPSRVDGPSASAASRAYRCEMDLSPGSRIRPRTRRAGFTVTAAIVVTARLYHYRPSNPCHRRPRPAVTNASRRWSDGGRRAMKRAAVRQSARLDRRHRMCYSFRPIGPRLGTRFA